MSSLALASVFGAARAEPLAKTSLSAPHNPLGFTTELMSRQRTAKGIFTPDDGCMNAESGDAMATNAPPQEVVN